MVNVEVDDGLNVSGHVNLNDGRQGQGPGRRPPGDAPEAGPNRLFGISWDAAVGGDPVEPRLPGGLYVLLERRHRAAVRHRSAASVAAEIVVLRDRFGLVGFSFFDDSFAVGRRRVHELCAAIRGSGRRWWTCTAHPAHLDREVRAEMRRAGCAGVDIGMESAYPGMLVGIGKGVTVERVLAVLGWCRDEGIHSGST